MKNSKGRGPGWPRRIASTCTRAGPWQASQLYDISYHITKWDGTVVQWDGIRTALPDVAPGQTVTVNVAVHAPAAGPYVIHFDVVREGVTWFSGQGVPTGDVALTAQ